jgi:hypothetical protein
MPLIHDSAVQSSLVSRLDRLDRNATPRWGRMSVDQMLWHVNEALLFALGRVQPEPGRPPLPRALVKFVVLNLPWPKGAPTNRRFVASGPYDFDGERARCRELIVELGRRPLDEMHTTHPAFGRMSGRDQSRLQAKHLDHHLRQFGV